MRLLLLILLLPTYYYKLVSPCLYVCVFLCRFAMPVVDASLQTTLHDGLGIVLQLILPDVDVKAPRLEPDLQQGLCLFAWRREARHKGYTWRREAGHRGYKEAI